MKIATLNIGLTSFQQDLTSWQQRAQKLAELINHLKIDVLMMQEVYDIKWEECNKDFKGFLKSLGIDKDFSKMEILKKYLSTDYFATTELIPSADRGIMQPGLYWGLSFITKAPIISSQHTKLPYLPLDRWQRIMQSVTIQDKAQKEIHLCNVHLSGESQKSRLAAVFKLLEYSKTKEGALFIGGDFNETSFEGPIKVMETHFSDVWGNAEQKKVFFGDREINTSSSLYRLVNDNRIDYILSEKNQQLVECNYYLDDLSPVSLSDHPLVMCQFNII